MTWWQRHFGNSTRGRVVALLRRGARSVEDIAAALGLTDNAVRSHLTALERDGVVRHGGIRRGGAVGKPPAVFEIAPEADTLFSGAYAPALAALVSELADRLPEQETEDILVGAGRRLAAAVPLSSTATFAERVEAAAALLAELGGDADVEQNGDGYDIRAYGCPLSRAVMARPETCRALEQLLASVTGASVHEHCDRAGTPHCRFAIAGAASVTR